MKRKITAMHDAYGLADPPHACKECCHFRTYEYHNKRFFKCRAYGISFSEATDWRAKYRACGFFNQSMAGMYPLFERLKHESRKEPEMQLEGQITIDDLLMGGVKDA